MGYTRISARVTDQAMQLTNTPLVASGGVNEVEVCITFCPLWDGCAKSAVFFNSEAGPFYEVVLADGVGVVPHEVLTGAGFLNFGVRGVFDDGTVRTTEVVQYTVENGTPVGDAVHVEPTADVYQQLLSLAASTRNIAQQAYDCFGGAAGAVSDMRGVVFDMLPITQDLMEFDYFVAFDSKGAARQFDVILKDATLRQVITRCFNVEADRSLTYYGISFFYDEAQGGYWFDSQYTNKDGETSAKSWEKVVGYKYPLSTGDDSETGDGAAGVACVTCIVGEGAPSFRTEGEVGALYLDTSTQYGTLYVCTAIGQATGENAGEPRYMWNKVLLTDQSLSIAGQPADAAAVGRALGDVETALDNILTIQSALIGGGDV